MYITFAEKKQCFKTHNISNPFLYRKTVDRIFKPENIEAYTCASCYHLNEFFNDIKLFLKGQNMGRIEFKRAEIKSRNFISKGQSLVALVISDLCKLCRFDYIVLSRHGRERDRSRATANN